MRILLAEPDDPTAKTLAMRLGAEGFKVETTDLGEDAIDLGKIYDYDAIVTTLEHIDVSGFEVIRALRLAKVTTPIIAISAIALPVEDRVRVLALGADDLLTKPVHTDELVARIHAVVRRHHGHQSSTIEIGPLVVDMGRQQAILDGNPLRLTGTEYALLETMALRKGACVTKHHALDTLYGGRDEPDMKIIDVFLCKLRKKFGQHAGMIETVWGRGYMLVEPRKEAA